MAAPCALPLGMRPASLKIALFAFVCLTACHLLAQDTSATARLTTAHAQYYTPTARGLSSFRCDASVDWKGTFARITGKEVAPDSPELKYLQSVRLSVSDELQGTGSLDWTTDAAPTADSDAAIKQIRGGFQQMISGFFQTWNPYVNGSMVPLPDSTVTVTNAGDGVHLSGKAGSMTLDEDFDRNMVLKQTVVVQPEIKVVATPTYDSTPEGLLVSRIDTVLNQPPTAPPVEAVMSVTYAKVDTYQLPSVVNVDIKNVSSFEIHFNNCKAVLTDSAKKP